MSTDIVDRLRADRRELAATVEGQVSVISSLQAEIERLRNVLKIIEKAARQCGYQTEQLTDLVIEIVREALGEKQ